MPDEQRKRRSKAEWAELVLQFESSGREAEDFARTHGLNPRTLKWWQSQLKAGSSYRKRSEPTSKSKSAAPVAAKPTKTRTKGLAVLTERLVDVLVAEPGLSVATLATTLRFADRAVRTELEELEALGVVYRRGKGPETRWFAG
ncbi:MAG: transposase [Myxococcota bacterium]